MIWCQNVIFAFFCFEFAFSFNVIERKFNKSEGKYLGWERKRGLLTQFNEYILKHEKNKFKINTINQENLPQIKYVITLDSDTDLVLNTAFELVGAMAHILNIPEIKNAIKDILGETDNDIF